MATTNFTTGTLIESSWLNDVDDHVYSGTTGHDASVITVTPAGNIAATDVQTALEELDAEKQPIDATLTALAGLTTGSNKIPYSTGTDTFGQIDFSTSTALGTSNTTIPSQNAIKTYVDTEIAGISTTVGDGDVTAPKLSGAQTGTAPVFGVRAWVRFNHNSGTPSITGSGNVTSVTSGGTGDYTINFTTALPNANYAVIGTGTRVSTNEPINVHIHTGTSPTTSSVRIRTGIGSYTEFNADNCCVLIIG